MRNEMNECGRPDCRCGERAEVFYQCRTQVGPDDERCGRVTGPFSGTYEYMPQGQAHFLRFDDEAAMTDALLHDDHGHPRPNYQIPVPKEEEEEPCPGTDR